MVKDDQASFTEELNEENNHLTLRFSGRLTMDSVAQLWQSVLACQSNYQPKKLTFDAEAIEYCDSAGVALILQLKEQQLKANQGFSLTGLSEQYQKLLNLAEQVTVKPIKHEAKRQPFITRVGQSSVGLWERFKQNLTYLGELCHELGRCCFNPTLIRWKDTWEQIEIVGPNALPIILLLGFLLGLILSFQSAIPLQRFGAVIYVANLVGISLTRELAPLLVAIILAGRTASSFAAELGTMQVNQEVDALKTMGLKPLLFLVVPRVLAVCLMTPILTLFMVVVGLIGSAVFMISIGYAPEIFIKQIHSSVTAGDLLGGLFKSIILGLVIAGIGCMHGLRTRFGASAVGESTTQAVVSCIVMIVIIDGVFAILFYVLGF